MPEPGTAKALQTLAREQAKYNLMKDIAADITVCRIEGWDYNEFLDDLAELIDHFRRG